MKNGRFNWGSPRFLRTCGDFYVLDSIGDLGHYFSYCERKNRAREVGVEESDTELRHRIDFKVMPPPQGCGSPYIRELRHRIAVNGKILLRRIGISGCWADCVFWPHAYYEKLAQTPGAFPYNGDDDRAALMLVRRGENRLPPEGFTKAYDLWGTPTQDQWARSNPADPNQKSETFLITEDDWGMPDFARLRTHPPGTEVYYAVLPKADAYDVPYSSYLRFAALLAIPILGFLLPFALTISTAWVVDGFKTERRN